MDKINEQDEEREQSPAKVRAYNVPSKSLLLDNYNNLESDYNSYNGFKRKKTQRHNRVAMHIAKLRAQREAESESSIVVEKQLHEISEMKEE